MNKILLLILTLKWRKKNLSTYLQKLDYKET